jgi:hypothetical protein
MISPIVLLLWTTPLDREDNLTRWVCQAKPSIKTQTPESPFRIFAGPDASDQPIQPMDFRPRVISSEPPAHGGNIKDLALLGPMGVASSRCITAADHTRALTARHPIKPTSPCCPSVRQPNPAETPLIDAENLFRQPGPPLSTPLTAEAYHEANDDP